jgi:malate dehydrogenase
VHRPSVAMLSRNVCRFAGVRGARFLATRAEAVKALAAEQKALSDAVASLGDSASYDKVKAFIDADPALKATIDKVKAADLSWTWSMLESAPAKPPVTVAVVGAGSDVGAAALFRIAAGEMLGLDQPVTLQLLGADAGVTKELEACGFPLLSGVSAAASPAAALKGASYALLLEGDMKACGAALGAGALAGVMGNTNALVAASAAKDASVTSITRPAEMAAASALASASGVAPTDVTNVIAWGAGLADISHAQVGGKWALKATSMDSLPGSASASAEATADAVVAHMKDWALGSDGKWVSMGVPAVGDYGMGEGIFYSVPVVCTPVRRVPPTRESKPLAEPSCRPILTAPQRGPMPSESPPPPRLLACTSQGEYKRVGGVTLSPAVAEAMEAERSALLAEKAAAGL